MALRTFSFVRPETRFFRAGSCIYMFKIRGGSSFSEKETMRGICISQELEDIVRTVLGNLDRLQPFSSVHFNIFPNKIQWKQSVMCNHCRQKLRVYPYVLILRLEINIHTAVKKQSSKNVNKQHYIMCEPMAKRCRRNSPLEEAILKDMIQDMVADSNMSLGSHGPTTRRCTAMNNPDSEAKMTEDTGRIDEQRSECCEVPQMKSADDIIREGQSSDSLELEPETNRAVQRPGILTWLASRIFPFSMFFKER
ncbi:membrane-anchored junction protein isoform X1 [Cynoglossus semilaevis]|uniref:Membrane anchored junction protein n=2 Tax=Cynoglossus semilaevis TaxID=244447 RepID=A0A3P8WP42_CYNSE|nr:membrane-anchored junction protein isoform X1 [Cynoglossus semilaevis]XP_024918731.1 membrane-anchored junction protein isoform X1 [Cynoglossus semilaevis]